jgi:hypothetical protein
MFKAESIDQRIRRNAPFLSRAFWKYGLVRRALGGEKALHPDYVCNYNSCENLADWTLGSGVTGSIDSSVFQENVGSLKLDIEAGLDRTIATLNLAQCNWYRGFWFRENFGDGTSIQIRFGAANGYHRINAYRSGATHQIRQEYYTSNGPDNYTGPYRNISPNTWYWIELADEAGTAVLYINGVYSDSGSRVATVTATYILAQVYPLSTAGPIWLDYIRYADRFEYPPA